MTDQHVPSSHFSNLYRFFGSVFCVLWLNYNFNTITQDFTQFPLQCFHTEKNWYTTSPPTWQHCSTWQLPCFKTSSVLVWRSVVFEVNFFCVHIVQANLSIVFPSLLSFPYYLFNVPLPLLSVQRSLKINRVVGLKIYCCVIRFSSNNLDMVCIVSLF